MTECFTARFGGQSVQIFVLPMAVLTIYAKENGRGMEFGHEYEEPPPPPASTIDKKSKDRSKPSLTLVKKDQG